ncbi:hypothetical protein Tco_0523140 [Tanacetum coccineum]
MRASVHGGQRRLQRLKFLSTLSPYRRPLTFEIPFYPAPISIRDILEVYHPLSLSRALGDLIRRTRVVSLLRTGLGSISLSSSYSSLKSPGIKVETVMGGNSLEMGIGVRVEKPGVVSFLSRLSCWKSRLGVIPRTVYHDLYLGEKALVERENMSFDLTKSDLCLSFIEGRKAHLLGDKQIPSVGVFDEVTWKTFGGNTRDLGSILEETGQEYDYTPKEGLKNKSQMVETASGKLATPSGSASDRVGKFVTASELSRHKETLEDSTARRYPNNIAS